MYYYNFHIGDFRSGTVNLSRLARWIYRDMLDVYYDTEKPLPLDLDVLCHLVGVETKEETGIVERLLKFKFEKTESGYINSVCERVIADYHLKADTARLNGKSGGRPKKTKETEEKPTGFLSGFNPVPIRNPVETGLKANQEPITINHKPITIESKEMSPSAPKFDPRVELANLGVDNQTIEDWLSHRKKKKADVSMTVIAEHEKQSKAAGITLEAALRIACSNGWTGFKADWIKNQSGASPEKKSRHSGFEQTNYFEGVTEDGRIA